MYKKFTQDNHRLNQEIRMLEKRIKNETNSQKISELQEEVDHLRESYSFRTKMNFGI
jgi:cell division septum initiation protein DivIVA